MAKLSVIIITLNEEKNLGRALASVRFADEIILNDSGSTDRTLDIAKELKCKVISTKFTGFGAAKNAALKEATGDWVLSIDADEEVDQELRESILTAIMGAAHEGYLCKRKSQFMGRWIMHSGWYPDKLLRLFKRGSGEFNLNQVHEEVVVSGSIAELEGHLLHYTDPDLSHYLKKMDRYTTLSAIELQKAGKAFHSYQLIVKPFATFVKMYFLKRGLLDGIQGLLLALLSSFHSLMKYAKLWELSRK